MTQEEKPLDTLARNMIKQALKFGATTYSVTWHRLQSPEWDLKITVFKRREKKKRSPRGKK